VELQIPRVDKGMRLSTCRRQQMLHSDRMLLCGRWWSRLQCYVRLWQNGGNEKEEAMLRKYTKVVILSLGRDFSSNLVQ
jgi:hypothetical protein